MSVLDSIREMIQKAKKILIITHENPDGDAVGSALAMYLTLKKLDIANLQDVMSLQTRIISNLHPDEQHFILHRTEKDYLKSLSGTSSNMLGVFDNDKLIAQIIYALPQNGEQRDMPEFKSDIPNNELVIYEAILVDSSYRGGSLMKKMLEYIEENLIDENRTHSIIQIAIDNPASWINALKHGMSITKVDKDPADGVKVIYLEKEIKKSIKKHHGFGALRS